MKQVTHMEKNGLHSVHTILEKIKRKREKLEFEKSK